MRGAYSYWLTPLYPLLESSAGKGKNKGGAEVSTVSSKSILQQEIRNLEFKVVEPASYPQQTFYDQVAECTVTLTSVNSGR